jgi:hypothetical protein
MTAKQYLRQIRDLDNRAENYRRYYERCLRDIALLQSPRLDADKVQSSGSGAGFTAAVEKLVDMQAEANRRIDEYIDKRDMIIRQINELEYPYSAILFKRYYEYKDFMVIADELDYNYTWTLELHGTALQLFARKYWLSQ